MAAAVLWIAVALGTSTDGATAAFRASTSNAANSFAAASSFLTYSQTVIADAPTCYFRMEEAAAATNAADSGANGCAGNYLSATPSFQVSGSPAAPADTAVTFPGTSAGDPLKATAAANTSLTNPNAFTIEVWFKSTSTNGVRFIGFGDKSNADGSSYYTDRYLQLENVGSVTFNVNGTVLTSSTSGYNDGAWHMAAASLGAAGMKLYVDGTLRGTNAAVTSGQTYPTPGYWWVGGDNVYFPGSLDEAAVILSQVTDARITAHYAAKGTLTSYTNAVKADTPWALWHLNDAAPTSLTGSTFSLPMADSSGSNHPGTYTGLRPQAIVQGQVGALPNSEPTTTSAQFKGAGWAYRAGNLVAGPTTFSEELWFKTSSTQGGQLIGFGDALTTASTNNDRVIYMRNDGTLAFGVNTSTHTIIASTASYNNNVWHHVVATDGSAGMKLYVDGASVASSAGTGSPGTSLGSWRWGGDTLTGWGSRPTSDCLNGYLDEVAVYAVQLSAAQVLAHYNAST